VFLVIADDDRDTAETLGDLLRLLVPPPVEILLVFDGEEALAAVTGQRTPDAVIMDIEMPRMNGVVSAAGIPSALGSKAPLMIAVTGHVPLFEVVSMNGAFDHALLKPVRVENLIPLLR